MPRHALTIREKEGMRRQLSNIIYNMLNDLDMNEARTDAAAAAAVSAIEKFLEEGR